MIRTPVALGDARFFAHEAMRTTFTLRFADLPEKEAKGVARECFELVDRLEDSLSRFREGGEVWRINHLEEGQTLYLSEACHRCLMKAMEAYQMTGGLFDATLGRRIQHHRDGGSGALPEIGGSIVIHPDVAAVTCGKPGRELDLGGIGKGFALDEIGALLKEWNLTDVLVAAGGSSILAVGDASWPIELSEGSLRVSLMLSASALSASGTGIQGNHILHPAREELGGAAVRESVWVTAPTAASAEIWSTALMLVADEELEDWLAGGGDFQEIWMESGGGIRRVFPPEAVS